MQFFNFPGYVYHESISQSVVSDSLQLMTKALQAFLSLEFSMQKYWNGLLFPSPGDLPDPGIQLLSPALAGIFFTTESPGKSVGRIGLYY